MHVGPESAKKPDNLAVFSALLGSSSIKAAPKMLMKTSPAVVVLGRHDGVAR